MTRLDEMGWAMAEVYEAVTNRILINLARRFPYVQKSDDLRGSFDYQARMLAQMGQVTRETVDIIAQSLSGADAALRQTLEAAITEALKDEEPKLRKAAEQGLLTGTAADLAPEQMQAFRYYYQQSADKLNLVNTVMLESTEAAYRATVADVASRIQASQSILNVAAGETITGVSAWNQAMRDAVRKMVDIGLTGYVDHGGHKWSPEAYVAMDIRSTTFNAAREATWELNDQYGNDLYQVSSHNGARPLCYPWQRKVISRTDTVRTVEDLDGNPIEVIAQSATSYGQAAGLFGVNCRHYPMSFIPGFSVLRGNPQDEAKNDEVYEQSQEQRKLERDLRQERAKMEALKAQGASKEDLDRQQERINRASDKIDDFCAETGRARRYNREYTPINATWPDKETWGDVSARRGAATAKTPEVDRAAVQVYKGGEKNTGAYREDVRQAIDTSVRTQNPMILQVINDAAPGCKIEWHDDSGTCHYSRGTGKIEMYTGTIDGGQRPIEEIVQTRWHEFFHYIDDPEKSGSPYLEDVDGYPIRSISSIAGHRGYGQAAERDVNAFLRRCGLDDRFEARASSSYGGATIYYNGEWLDPLSPAARELDDALVRWVDEASGKTRAENYIYEMGFPRPVDRADYIEVYYTPKRHQYREREKFPGATEAYYAAEMENEAAREAFRATHDMDAILAEAERLQQEAERAANLLGAVTDTFDGGAYGAFGSAIMVGGHPPSYYGSGNNAIGEGVANIGSCLVTDNQLVIRGMQDLCPNIFRLISGIITGQEN